MKEASKAMIRRSNKEEYNELFTGYGIDIGCGDDCIDQFKTMYPLMKSVRGYDLKDGDAESCLNLMDESFDFLHSSHCLEHLKDPKRGILNWIRVVKTNGHLIITVPDEFMYEKGVWPSRFNSQHYWSFRFGGHNPRESSIDATSWFDQFTDVEVISIKRITDNYLCDTEEDMTKQLDPPVECAIEIVLKKISHSYKPVSHWALNGFCFMLNSLAMGDVIAAVPVVKYMIERYYTDQSMYRVVAKSMFRQLFWFVPDSNFCNFEDKDNNWGISQGWSIGVLNQSMDLLKGTGMTRNTPKSIHLSQFAAFKLCDKLLPLSELNYIKLPTVDTSHFDVDFTKSVVLVSTYRDETRMWESSYMLELARWIREQNLIPVFIGKTDMNLDTHLIPKSSLPPNISIHGVDLRNKTTILELASIMGLAKAVVGLDSGPIHLAGTTETPIVCGFTSIDPIYRIPLRSKGEFYPVVISELPCNHCESNWAGSFWNYELCYLGTNDCCKSMTADRFIEKLKLIL